MSKSLGLFLLSFAVAAPGAHAKIRIASEGCTDSVVRGLAPPFVKDNLQKQGTTVAQCVVEDLDRLDPGNPGETIHFVATLKCDGEYVPYYILDAKQDAATGDCSLSRFVTPHPVAPAPETPSSWTIDQFIAALAGNQYASVEQALLSLPESVRSSFTLLHQGHGLRGTTPALPGVVLFSMSGEYAITFGDESQALGNELEIFRFDTATNRGELVRAAFPPENPALRALGTTAVTVEKNPVQCTTCHQADPMMRWGTYGTWKGAYGSADDTIDPNGADPESRSFISFMNARPNLPRYRTLVPPKGETGIYPYWDNSPVSPYTSLTKDARSSLRPNFRLGTVVTLLDARRLARKIMESPEYAKNRAQLLASMLGCEKDYPKFSAALSRVGISPIDLQPNILEPIQADKLPDYSDGFSGYGPGANSVVDYAAGPLYRDLVKDHPELGGNFEETSAVDFLSPGYWVFGAYPETVRMFTDAQKLGSFMSAKSESAQQAFCDQLQKPPVAVSRR